MIFKRGPCAGRFFLLVWIVCLPVFATASAPVQITEFMAANANGLRDEDGDFSDWIELHNGGANPVDLADWSLTDSETKLTKWRFPATNLVAGGYLVVFASEKNRRTPGALLHTNFKLASTGEYLALVEPDGATLASSFAPAFPPQAADISYGFGKVALETTLIATGAVARFLIPTDGALGTVWTEPGFADASWAEGPAPIGFGKIGSAFKPVIATDIQARMYANNASAYFRWSFEVTDPGAFDHLSLFMKYDDGFIAYLNGLQIAAANDPLDRTWNSASAAERSDAEALADESYDLDSQRGLLRPGRNWLAIHGLNSAAADPAFLMASRLVASREATATNILRYFTKPTPGGPNPLGVADLGPIISDESHDPAQPAEGQDILVAVRVAPAFAPIASLELRYRVMFEGEIAVPMADDGLHQDGAAGDGIYGATIPGGAVRAGQMVRWFITARDKNERSSRWPLFDDPRNSPQYSGTMMASSVTSALPVLHWFVQNPAAAETDAGTSCSLFFDGELYDNIAVHIRGQASRGYPKKSFKFDFLPGHHFRFDRSQKRVEEMNVNTTYADKSFLRVTLAWESFRKAGAPHCLAFPLRLEQNNAFYSVATFLEEPDGTMLRRNGLDPNGAFYKMFNSLESASGNQKTTRLNEDNSDLQALVDALKTSPSIRTAWLFDNINIPAVLDYMAVICLIHDNDCPHKNYWMYRDTEGTGEWRMFPWDKDLSFGRNYVSGLDDEIWANKDLIPGRADVSPSHPFFMDRTHQKYDYRMNFLIDALYAVPAIKDMYRRHLRTVMEDLLQPPEAPRGELRYDRRIQELYAQMQPDVVLDRAKWAYGYGQPLSFEQGIGQVVTNYLPLRRIHLFRTHQATNSSYPQCALLPAATPSDAAILFGDLEANPASGLQSEEYIQLLNTNLYAVDLSGWKIAGDVEHRFQPGVVMPANSLLYLSPNVKAFRARKTGPRGGQSYLVQGNYRGELSARGATLQLSDRAGRVVSQTNYPGSPSLAQQFLRVTEIMYHPSAAAGSPDEAAQFEYIELKNIGPAALNLAGVRLSKGISFSFSAGAVQELSPGQSVVVVKNQAAFAARYPGGATVAGEFTGTLDNAGEVLRLDDATGEAILEFAYDHRRLPMTDGAGFSLVIADETAPWTAWNLPASWRASAAFGGSPGHEEPALAAFVPVRITEVLTHSEPPLQDAVELHNPTASEAAIGGWWLTDDFATPQKYRIASGTRIPPLGYWVLDESQFNPNPGVPPSFSFRARGDEVYLFSADAAGTLTGYVHGYRFGAASSGVSFGPYTNSLGEETLVARATRTLGGPNSPPLVGPVVISEIFYRPLEVRERTDGGQREFLELHNLSGAAVQLFDAAAPLNTWRISGGIEFAFPRNAVLEPNGYAVLVGFDPAHTQALASFRAEYDLPDSVRVFGPYEGALGNSGEGLRLYRPESPSTPGEVLFVLADEVAYGDRAPWPELADGLGASLQRMDEHAFGNDPANWRAAAPGAGRSFPGGEPPQFTLQPVSQNAVGYQTVTLSALASGTAPLRYQWMIEGAPLYRATNAQLTLASVQLWQQGRFQVVVLSPAGAALSSNALIHLDYPPLITSQPRSQVAVTNNSATFNVSAVGTGPFRYQWYLNGLTLPDVTNASVTVTHIQLENHGAYSVLVSDSIGSIWSQAASLTVATRPVFVAQPQSQTAVQGDAVTFSVVVSGTDPIGYRWRKNGNTIPGALARTFTLSSVKLTDSGARYSVVVTNLSPTPKVSGEATLIVLADFDGDHIADIWETANGLSTNNASDALLDLDGDSLNNFQEFIAGTDPHDPNSYLRIDVRPLDGNNQSEVVLQFLAVSNKTYTVQATDLLGGGAWSNVAHVAAQSQSIPLAITNALSKSAFYKYYRLVTPRLP